MTWRIRHAGIGWIASNDDGTGAYFPTWGEALAFVDRHVSADRAQAWADFDTDFRRGILKLASRGVPTAGYPAGRPPISDTEVRIAQAMRENQRSWEDIGAVLERHPRAIRSAVWRATHPTRAQPETGHIKPAP